MENLKIILEFLEKEIDKYDEQASDMITANQTLSIHLTGIANGLYIAKSFIEVNCNKQETSQEQPLFK